MDRSTTQKKSAPRVEAWLKEAEKVRDAILAEREELLHRLTELDAQMMMLPKQVRASITVPLESGITYSLPGLVRNQVKAAGKAGITAQALVEIIDEMLNGASHPGIHAALSRGVRNGTFTRAGKRGSAVYRLGP